MKYFIFCVVVFFFKLSGIVLASQPETQKPINVEMVYEDGIGISAQMELKKLTRLLLKRGGKDFNVPPKEMNDIWYPELDLISLQVAHNEGPDGAVISIYLQFARRQYEWGQATSEARFVFVGGKFSFREIKVPVGKGRFETMSDRHDGRESE